MIPLMVPLRWSRIVKYHPLFCFPRLVSFVRLKWYIGSKKLFVVRDLDNETIQELQK